MLTLPVKQRRRKQPYLAIRSRLTARQLPKQAQHFIPEVRKFMRERGIEDIGPSFFRYSMVSGSKEMEIEFGHFTDKVYPGAGPIRSGVLPGGSFMSVTWTGHYSHLTDVHAMLLGWGHMKDVEWDVETIEDRQYFGCRIDVFHKSMRNEPNPDNWVTELAVQLKGGFVDR
jgi:effector-binding domain-containing protein